MLTSYTVGVGGVDEEVPNGFDIRRNKNGVTPGRTYGSGEMEREGEDKEPKVVVDRGFRVITG